MKVRIYCEKQEITFLSFNIRKSIDEICHYGEIKIPFAERDKVNKHNTIKIMYETPSLKSRPLTTLYIDEITTTINNTEKSVTVIGRSPARDIVDSSYSATIPEGSLLKVVSAICNDFGITAIHYLPNIDPSPNIPSFNFENESPWTKILSTAENNDYSIASNQAGNLYVFDKKQYIANNANHKFIEGVNIKSIEYTQNGAKQFAKYIIKGNGKEITKTDNIDSTSKRVLTINLTDALISEKEIETRAKSELKRRRENILVITVSGFGLTDAQIKSLASGVSGGVLGKDYQREVFYEVKQEVSVNIPSLNMKGFMTIKDVKYTASNTDFYSTITLVDFTTISQVSK